MIFIVLVMIAWIVTIGFETMNIKEIVADSLRYPFRDWKKFWGKYSVNCRDSSFINPHTLLFHVFSQGSGITYTSDEIIEIL